MDSGGNFYGNAEARKRLEETFEDQARNFHGPRERVRPMEEKPSDAIDVDEAAAVELAQMNRRQRMVFYSERGHKKSVEEALQAARESLPK